MCSLTIIFALLTTTAFSQTEKLGIVKYTPPTGWNKTQKEDLVALSILNQATGAF